MSKSVDDFSPAGDLSLFFTGEQETEAPDVDCRGRVGLSLGFTDMQGDGWGRWRQFEVFGRPPVEDEKDEDDMRDQEGDDDKETVVGRFW